MVSKTIGHIEFSRKYIIEFEDGKYRLIKLGRGWVPASSNYPIDPRLEWEGDTVVLETENIDELIEKIRGLIIREMVDAEEMIKELNEEYRRYPYKHDFYECWLAYYHDKYNNFARLEKRINEIKEAIVNRKEFKWKWGVYRIEIAPRD